MQRATGPRLLRDHPRPARHEPRPRDRKSSTLTTRLSRHPKYGLIRPVCLSIGLFRDTTWFTYRPWRASSRPTSGNVDEVFAAGSVHFNVALTKMMFVSTKGERSMFAVLEPHQRFTVTSSLLTQAQRHTAPEVYRQSQSHRSCEI